MQPGKGSLTSFSASHLFYTVVLFFLGGVFLFFYIQYASSAWFYQDDFGFLWQYQQTWHIGDILHRSEDFGRFITRNAYWHILWSVFGENARLYFFTNLTFLLINSYLIFFLVNQHTDNLSLAAGSAIAYFIAPPTVANFSWLSNSQHIIAHSFIFLFLILSTQKEALQPCKKSYQAGIIIVYLMGIYSNLLALFALPPVMLYWLVHPDTGHKTLLKNKLFLSLLTALTLFFLFGAQHFAAGPYDIGFTLDIFKNNIAFYKNALVSGNFWPAILILSAYFTGVIIYACIKRNVSLLFFITAAMSFYLPFAFLRYQHYMNYIALTFIFTLISLLYLLRRSVILIMLVLLIQFFNIGRYSLVYTANYAMGANLEQLVASMKNFDLASINTLCFKIDPKNNHTAMPAFWWETGFGKAFQIFLNTRTHYVLSQKAKSITACDMIVTINPENYQLSDVKMRS